MFENGTKLRQKYVDLDKNIHEGLQKDPEPGELEHTNPNQGSQIPKKSADWSAWVRGSRREIVIRSIGIKNRH